jgi:PIN domain nuclease of toxin-antitoxin system
VKALLDTHALLWAVINPELLSRQAAALIADESNIIVVSAASAWEIATKVRIGKLPHAGEMEREFLDVIEDAGYVLLAIEAADALRAGRLAGDHGDPFDRMIAAQALAGDVPVISNDTRLDVFRVRRIW